MEGLRIMEGKFNLKCNLHCWHTSQSPSQCSWYLALASCESPAYTHHQKAQAQSPNGFKRERTSLSLVDSGLLLREAEIPTAPNIHFPVP